MGAMMKAQAENLEIVEHKWGVATAEQSLLSSPSILSPQERKAFQMVKSTKSKAQ